ncbi:lipoprotein insertase outer membrane protein LolB [Arsenophonus symbiont of Ornithomya chloropus]|uniref:lipoprotein insertase outer membrane protein LolB n=1 Tax=Arsenophonus symbiont of Ornithomya chloropus TaxID=634121 RepID=UPI0032B2E7E9
MILNKKHFTSLSYFSYTFIFLCIILLTACTFKPTLSKQTINKITNTEWAIHKKKLIKLIKFNTRGSFSYIDGYNKIYANFFLQQNNFLHYYLFFSNPLGTTEFMIYVTPNFTTITDKAGKNYTTTNPEQLIHQLINIKIPIENFSYWLIGLPINATSFTLNKNGLLKTIQYIQNKETWNINYLSYSTKNKLKLPNNIELQQSDRYIKLKIHNWDFKL